MINIKNIIKNIRNSILVWYPNDDTYLVRSVFLKNNALYKELNKDEKIAVKRLVNEITCSLLNPNARQYNGKIMLRCSYLCLTLKWHHEKSSVLDLISDELDECYIYLELSLGDIKNSYSSLEVNSTLFDGEVKLSDYTKYILNCSFEIIKDIILNEYKNK